MLDHGRLNGKFSFVLNINNVYIENKLNLIRTNDSTIFLPFSNAMEKLVVNKKICLVPRNKAQVFQTFPVADPRFALVVKRNHQEMRRRQQQR